MLAVTDIDDTECRSLLRQRYPNLMRSAVQGGSSVERHGRSPAVLQLWCD